MNRILNEILSKRLVRFTLWFVIHAIIVSGICIYGDQDRRGSFLLLMGYLNTVIILQSMMLIK